MSKITRTICKTTATVVMVDKANKALVDVSVAFPYTDVSGDEKAILVQAGRENRPLIPVYVESVTVDPILYGVDESKFIQYAKKADKRGSETRGCISKDVSAFEAVCLVFDEVTAKPETRKFPIPAKADPVKLKQKLNRAAKGYTVVSVKSIEETTGLYYMPVSNFVALAEVIEKEGAVE